MNLQQLKIDLGESEAQTEAIRKQIAEAEKKERADALAPVLAAIKQHGFTAAELGLATAPKAKAEKAKASTAGVKVESKYRDPISGKEWTGRGKSPSWLAALLAEGRDKEDFLIKPAAPAVEQSAGQPT